MPDPAMVTRWLVWTNLLMAGSAAGWVIVTLKMLALPNDGFLIALAFALSLAFYTRDRLDQGEHQADRLTMPARTAWLQIHQATLRRVVRVAFFCALLLVVVRPAAAPPLLVGLGFALSYTARWLPWRGHRLGWKHLPGMKMPFVAGLWTLTTVITPATVYGQLWTGQTWLLAGAICALIMVQILLNDLRDVDGDRFSGTHSLAVLLGQRRARQVGYGLAMLAILLAWPVARLPILVTAAYSLYLLSAYRRDQDQRWRLWIEGQGSVGAMIALLIQK